MSIRLLSSVAFVAMSLAACSPKAPDPAPVVEVPATPAAPAIVPFTDSIDVKAFKIGAFEAAALRDGGISVPNDNKTLATNKKKKDVADLLTANALAADPIELSAEPLIVRTTDKVLLFDAGAGTLFGPTMGKLGATMSAAAIDPGTVTDIFISHAHGDHVGGLVTGTAPALTLTFPSASIHISANEWAAMKGNKDMAAIVTTITPKVVEFQPDAEIVPGVVKAIDIKGHTPGHSGYLITSGTDTLLYQGDVMHHSVVSVQQPDWTIAFDTDAKTAQASRKAFLEAQAAAGQRIYAPHFPFPGLGKYEKQGDKFVWVAEK